MASHHILEGDLQGSAQQLGTGDPITLRNSKRKSLGLPCLPPPFLTRTSPASGLQAGLDKVLAVQALGA